MSNNPLVSIIIPVYNGSNFVCEAIDSALAQTYENCEIIVVNDGSTDDTEQACLSYGDKIRYYSKENGGVATALNLAISKMHGDYFSWLSHDDIYYPNKVGLQIEALKSCGEMSRITFGDYANLDQETGVITLRKLDSMYSKEQLNDSVFSVLKGHVGGCSLLIHKSHFERVGVFNESQRYTNDYDLWFRIMRNQECLYINHPLFISRVHKRQSGQVHVSRFLDEQVMLAKCFYRSLTEDEIRRFYNNKFLFLYDLYCGYRIYETSNKSFDFEIADAVKECNVESRICSVVGSKKVFIFGAGYNGKSVYFLLKFANISCAGFLDSNSLLHGTTIIDGIKCFSLDEIKAFSGDIFCIVSPIALQGIKKQLNTIGVKDLIYKHDLEQVLRS